MSKLFNKLFGWLKISNRPKHMKAGLIITIVLFALQMVSNMIATKNIVVSDSYTNITYLSDAVVTSISTLVAMCSVEYILKQYGGKWDWLDIIAGCIPSIILILVLILILFI